MTTTFEHAGEDGRPAAPANLAGKPSKLGVRWILWMALACIAHALLLSGIACSVFSQTRSLGGGLFWAGIGVLGLALFSVPEK